MKTNISVTLDRGLINQLEEVARCEDRSLSAVLRLASRQYLRGFIKPDRNPNAIISAKPTKKTRKAA